MSRDRQESHEEPHRATAVAESEERAAHVPSDALGGGGVPPEREAPPDPGDNSFKLPKIKKITKKKTHCF